MDRRTPGFSLVEVMVVVAIIGVLAIIAVPSYERFLRRARQAEAKTVLSTIFVAQKSFYLQHETYSPRLDALGVDFHGAMSFDIGFGSDLAPYPASIPRGTPSCLKLCPASNCPGASWTCKPSAGHALDGGVPSFANQTSFRAGAHVHWNGRAVSPVESWWINDQRQMRRVANPN